MILFEGCDRCGKTTAALKLRHELGDWSYRHHTKPPWDPFAYHLQAIADSTTRVILDRCHYSNLIYESVFHNQPQYTPENWMFMELTLLALQCTVIWMDDEFTNIQSRWSEDEMYKSESALNIAQAYRDYFRDKQPYDTSLQVLRMTLPDLVDMDKDTATQKLQRLGAIERAKWVHAQNMRLVPPTGGIGNVRPGGFVIIGEEPSPVQYKDHYAARLPFDAGPAAEWLWKSRALRKVNVSRGYYTNASAYNTPEKMLNLLRYMKPEAVVMLGAVANDMVRRARMIQELPCKFYHVRHPMAARRFDFSNFETYADELTEGLTNFMPEENDGSD